MNKDNIIPQEPKELDSLTNMFLDSVQLYLRPPVIVNKNNMNKDNIIPQEPMYLYNIIPQEPIDLDFQTPDDVEQELRRRENEDLDLLFTELNN